MSTAKVHYDPLSVDTVGQFQDQLISSVHHFCLLEQEQNFCDLIMIIDRTIIINNKNNNNNLS